jgi:hypothetical protein
MDEDTRVLPISSNLFEHIFKRPCEGSEPKLYYVAPNEGAAGEGISVLLMTEEAEAAGARIASPASRNARTVPAGEGSD